MPRGLKSRNRASRPKLPEESNVRFLPKAFTNKGIQIESKLGARSRKRASHPRPPTSPGICRLYFACLEVTIVILGCLCINSDDPILGKTFVAAMGEALNFLFRSKMPLQRQSLPLGSGASPELRQRRRQSCLLRKSDSSWCDVLWPEGTSAKTHWRSFEFLV